MHSNRITQSVIIGLAALVATITWSGLKSILFEDGNWILPCLGFLILLIFLGLNWVLTKSREVLLITLIFILISFLFAFSFKIEYLVVLVVALLFFILGSFRAIKEKEIRIKIHINRILKRGLPYILTGLALIIATAYYFSPLALKSHDQIEVPRFLFDIIIKPMTKTFEGQIQGQYIIPLPLDVLEDNENLQDALYQTINREINKYSQPYKQYFPLGLAIGLFFTLRFIAIPFSWLVVLLSWLIFKVLIYSGAIKIQEKAVLKEVIEI